MGKARNPWQDGRRAWQRLNGWHQEGASATPGHPDDGEVALNALADVGLVRHLLDQAELVAVRTARRHRKSWAEIATKLGVTRQSAWERWRDLDEAGSPQPAGSESRREIVQDDECVARHGAFRCAALPGLLTQFATRSELSDGGLRESVVRSR